MSNSTNTAEEEYKILLLAILKQAMDDYIKLQHPRFRKKKYLQEAFDSAVSLFFDDEHRFLYLKNNEGDYMSMKDLLSYFVSDKNMDIEKLRTHLIQEGKIFWENKFLNVIDIPESFIYDGHVYSIYHADDDFPVIDYQEKTITMNKDSTNSDNQQAFVKAAVEVMLYHEEIPISKKYIDQLSKAFFRMLKVNSCFLES